MSRVSEGVTQKGSPYYGLRVTEYCQIRLDEIAQEIRLLSMERGKLQRRMVEYCGSTMLEAERRATAAEPYQSVQLPQIASTGSTNTKDAQDRV